MVSKNTTVTRISKITLGEVRKIADRQDKTVTFILDDMLRVYQLVNGIWEGKEDKDAKEKKVAA